MNETRAILDAFDSITQRRECCALATVVSVSGSAYRRPGARMRISPTGQTFGGISGGCLDRDVVRRPVSTRVIQTNRPILRSYDSTDDGDFAPGHGRCASAVTQILIPTPQRPNALVRFESFQRVQSILHPLHLCALRSSPRPFPPSPSLTRLTLLAARLLRVSR